MKIKQALPETASYLSPSDLINLSGSIRCEQPNNRLYNYDGTLALNLADGKQKDFALDPSKLLLRGAQLRNTSWIYGIAVFTGHETKLMLNSRFDLLFVFVCIYRSLLRVFIYSKKPTKASNVTRITNRNILYLFTMLVIMSILCSVGNLVSSVSRIEENIHSGRPMW